SLVSDVYTRILKDTSPNGYQHYAILPDELADDSRARDRRIAELGAWNVLPIWYPADEHGCVLAILRGLVDPPHYRRSGDVDGSSVQVRGGEVPRGDERCSKVAVDPRDGSATVVEVQLALPRQPTDLIKFVRSVVKDPEVLAFLDELSPKGADGFLRVARDDEDAIVLEAKPRLRDGTKRNKRFVFSANPLRSQAADYWPREKEIGQHFRFTREVKRDFALDIVGTAHGSCSPCKPTRLILSFQ
ncbi:MAG: hypothetical protein AAF368_13540, partial [Planctomycetota bacterium]